VCLAVLAIQKIILKALSYAKKKIVKQLHLLDLTKKNLKMPIFI